MMINKIIEYFLTKLFKYFDYYTIKGYFENIILIAYLNNISNNQGKEIVELINKAYKKSGSLNDLSEFKLLIEKIENITYTSFPELVKLRVILKLKTIMADKNK